MTFYYKMDFFNMTHIAEFLAGVVNRRGENKFADAQFANPKCDRAVDDDASTIASTNSQVSYDEESTNSQVSYDEAPARRRFSDVGYAAVHGIELAPVDDDLLGPVEHGSIVGTDVGAEPSYGEEPARRRLSH